LQVWHHVTVQIGTAHWQPFLCLFMICWSTSIFYLMHISGVINPVLPSLEDDLRLRSTTRTVRKQWESNLIIACFLTRSCASTPLSINAWTRAAHTCSFDKHPLQNYTYQATFSPMSTLGEYKNTVKKSRKIYSPSVTGNSLTQSFQKETCQMDWSMTYSFILTTRILFWSLIALMSWILFQILITWLHAIKDMMIYT